MKALAAVLGLLIVASACTSADSTDTSTSETIIRVSTTLEPAVGTSAVAIDERERRAGEMCFGSPVDPVGTDVKEAGRILDGRVVIGRHEEVDLALDPHWLEDPLEDANWKYGYQTLSWVDRLRRVGNIPGANERYRDLLLDWWSDNGAEVVPTTSQTVRDDYRWFDMSTAWRALVYVCALEEFGPEEWLLTALEVHGEVLSSPDAYAGRGNHALHQDMALVAIGHVLDREEWVSLGSGRATGLLESAIDAAGVSTEGSASYQLKNYRWWSEARDRLRAVGIDTGPAWERLDAMPESMSHFVAPDGEWILLGDTVPGAIGRSGNEYFDYAVTMGEVGTRPTEHTVAFDAGYLLSRNTWSFDSPDRPMTLLGLRFGASMADQVHAHEDLGSVVFYEGDRRIVEDSGLYAYFGGEIRTHMVSNEAHNVVTIDDAEYYRSAVADLTAWRSSPGWVFANISTGAIEGARWQRTVVGLLDHGVIIIDDRISQSVDRPVWQQWHLEPDIELIIEPRRVVSTTGDLTVLVLGEGDYSIDLGDGVRSTQQRKAFAVPVLRVGESGSARFTTVLATSAVSAELVWRSTSGFSISGRAGGTPFSVKVGDGTSGRGLEVRVGSD
mgnify:CR=1 FL=1